MASSSSQSNNENVKVALLIADKQADENLRYASNSYQPIPYLSMQHSYESMQVEDIHNDINMFLSG